MESGEDVNWPFSDELSLSFEHNSKHIYLYVFVFIHIVLNAVSLECYCLMRE